MILPRVFPTGTGGPERRGASGRAESRPQDAVLAAVQLHHRAAAVEHRLPRVLYRHGACARACIVQLQFSASRARGRTSTKPRPFPQLPGHLLRDQRRRPPVQRPDRWRPRATWPRGSYFQSSWTWARDRYDMDYNWDFGTDKFTPEDPCNRQREIGPAQEIPTHRLHYQLHLPAAVRQGARSSARASHGWANLAVGGWEISGIYTAQSGQFLTPFWTGDDPAEYLLQPTTSRRPRSLSVRTF